mmetsp:Transcript_107212/g.303784  ORF Transcript_107212/g.303784 Transcript_107212/m.303784 type:complete len:210 (-) Transcript_107212:1638-2267(-)
MAAHTFSRLSASAAICNAVQPLWSLPLILEKAGPFTTFMAASTSSSNTASQSALVSRPPFSTSCLRFATCFRADMPRAAACSCTAACLRCASKFFSSTSFIAVSKMRRCSLNTFSFLFSFSVNCVELRPFFSLASSCSFSSFFWSACLENAACLACNLLNLSAFLTVSPGFLETPLRCTACIFIVSTSSFLCRALRRSSSSSTGDLPEF